MSTLNIFLLILPWIWLILLFNFVNWIRKISIHTTNQTITTALLKLSLIAATTELFRRLKLVHAISNDCKNAYRHTYINIIYICLYIYDRIEYYFRTIQLDLLILRFVVFIHQFDLPCSNGIFYNIWVKDNMYAYLT